MTIAPRGTPAASAVSTLQASSAATSDDDVGVGRVPVHVRGAPAHVHQHQGRARLHGDVRDGRVVPQPADVVDHRGARVHGGPRDQRLGRIHGDGDGHLPGQCRDDRLDARPLDGRIDLRRARARGLPADVDQVGPRRDHREGGIDGPRQVGMASAVREAVGRDVQDPHDERPRAELERAPAGEREGVAAAGSRGSSLGGEGSVGLSQPDVLRSGRRQKGPLGQRALPYCAYSCASGLFAMGIAVTIDGRGRRSSDATSGGVPRVVTGSGASREWPAMMCLT